MIASVPAVHAQAGAVTTQQYPPAVPEPKPYHLPTPSVQKLPNGLTLVVVERHSLPLATLRLVVKSGAESDPANAMGAAQMVTSLLNQGTARRSALEIAAAIDAAGGEIDTGAEWDDSYAELSVLGDHTEAAFDLLADMTRNPAFAPAELERKRRQTLSALEVAYQDPGYLADTAFRQLALEGTPYGHPQDGTTASVRRLTRDDLLAFHAQYYRPGNSILAAVGDITPEEALRLAGKFFGDWKGDASANTNQRGAIANEKTRIIAIDKPDAVQTEIRVGNYGIRRNSQDYVALTVANQILGGPAANRLFSALRTERGLTYGASSELNCYRTAGTWEAKTSTRTPETIKALKVILSEMQTLREHSITPTELSIAKSYLVGHQALEFESSRSVAEHVVDLMVYGLPLDDVNQFPDRVRALTSSDVAEAIQRHLETDHLAIVLVGNIAGFKKQLKKLGRTQIIPAERIDFGAARMENSSGAADKP
jgi:zinc protease